MGLTPGLLLDEMLLHCRVTPSITQYWYPFIHRASESRSETVLSPNAKVL